MKTLTKGKRETAEILLGMKEDRGFTSFVIALIFGILITVLIFSTSFLAIVLIFPYYFMVIKPILKLRKEIHEIREILKEGKLLYGWNFRE